MAFERELIILGCGGSVGVPAIGCDSPVCLSDDPRNNRTRTGVFVPAPQGNFVIDTSPELRIQLVRERIPVVHAALFTHSHADHIFGLDDLRICGFRLRRPISLYCEEPVERQIRQSFDYAFRPRAEDEYHSVPNFRFTRVGLDAFDLLGLKIIPIRLIHGRLPILGFRIGDVAFCTDASEIPEESWPRLEGLDVLVIGALRDTPHPTHFNIPQALDAIEKLRPRQAFLTHLSTELDYDETNRRLPPHVRLAYDGLRIPF
ncbi:MAG: MBL fold metallo-hydrolase [Planctomycetaceae bacterium]